MKNNIKSVLLLLCTVGLFGACSDDNDSNPTMQIPQSFQLNTPAISENNVVDLANSQYINLTCNQPDFGGLPVQTQYTVEVGTKADMSDAQALSSTFYTTRMQLDASEVASTLTNIELANGKTEADFPLNTPVYFRAIAKVYNAATKQPLEDTKVISNIVKLNNVKLLFSLPPVSVPSNIYINGAFSEWNWDKAVTMTEVNGTRDNNNTSCKYWHLVYIDGAGIKFNSATKWDGNEVGFSKITVDPASELASDIEANGDGNISSKNPGWYLMIVSATVSGRDILYTVTFNKPMVYFMGRAAIGLAGVTADNCWDEATVMASSAFTVPATADGDFVSPALPALPGTDDDGCIRMWVKIPTYDWWKSEFIVGIDADKISYRGNGGDQTRVGSTAGQKVYLNFSTDKGSVK